MVHSKLLMDSRLFELLSFWTCKIRGGVTWLHVLPGELKAELDHYDLSKVSIIQLLKFLKHFNDFCRAPSPERPVVACFLPSVWSTTELTVWTSYCSFFGAPFDSPILKGKAAIVSVPFSKSCPFLDADRTLCFSFPQLLRGESAFSSSFYIC